MTKGKFEVLTGSQPRPVATVPANVREERSSYPSAVIGNCPGSFVRLASLGRAPLQNLAKPPFFILRQSSVGKTVHIVVAHFDVQIDGNTVYGFDLCSFNSNGYFCYITLTLGDCNRAIQDAPPWSQKRPKS